MLFKRGAVLRQSVVLTSQNKLGLDPKAYPTAGQPNGLGLMGVLVSLDGMETKKSKYLQDCIL